MSLKVLQAFVGLVLLSVPILGEEKIMVCKNIENVFSDVENEPPPTNMARLQGPPGKRGQQGLQGLAGPPGPPGIQGIPGPKATVDYHRISKMIEGVRQELKGINTTVGNLKTDVTQLLQGQHCKEENGLPYNGKCYIVPEPSNAADLSYEQAVQKCNARGAVIAEVHSMAQQQAVQDAFQSSIPAAVDHISLFLPMTYQSSTRTLRYRSGKEVSINQFKWHRGFPRGPNSRLGIQISFNRGIGLRWFFNWPTTGSLHGVLCEKNL